VLRIHDAAHTVEQDLTCTSVGQAEP
jgi:hypothetical protein